MHVGLIKIPAEMTPAVFAGRQAPLKTREPGVSSLSVAGDRATQRLGVAADMKLQPVGIGEAVIVRFCDVDAIRFLRKYVRAHAAVDKISLIAFFGFFFSGGLGICI